MISGLIFIKNVILLVHSQAMCQRRDFVHFVSYFLHYFDIIKSHIPRINVFRINDFMLKYPQSLCHI